MADITQTAANVRAQSNARVNRGGLAGATIVAGNVVYKEASSGKYKLADNDHATAEVRGSAGIALNGAADNQPLNVCEAGDINLGATLVAGTTYCVSSTAGAICPQADVASGDEVIVLGVAKSTSLLTLSIQDPGVTL